MFHEVFPFVAEVVPELDRIRLSLLGTPEVAILDSVTANFIAPMKVKALNSVITAWVISGHGRRTVRVDEAHFMMRMTLPAGEALLDESCGEAMSFRFEQAICPISSPDSEPATGLEPSAFTPPENLMVDRAQGDPGEIGQTPVEQQGMNFNRTLREQFRRRARVGRVMHIVNPPCHSHIAWSKDDGNGPKGESLLRRFS
jgi:hypothetical protein